jgi:hypothetical protein
MANLMLKARELLLRKNAGVGGRVLNEWVNHSGTKHAKAADGGFQTMQT